MFLSRRISMLLLLSGFFYGLQADFVTLSVWERTLPSGEKQHVICCGDQHIPSAHRNQQIDDLVRFIAERKCELDCILVEDASSLDHVVPYVEQYVEQYGHSEFFLALKKEQERREIFKKEREKGENRGVLFGITPYAERFGVRVLNFEFRCLNFPEQPTSWNQFEHGIRWWDLGRKINGFMYNKVLEELEAYNDNDVLIEFYKDLASRYTNIIKAMCCNHDVNKIGSVFENADSVKEMLNKKNSLLAELGRKRLILAKEHPFNAENDFWFGEALDAKFLHHIYRVQIEQEQSNTVVVCAGAAHTVNVERMLNKLGYTCLYNEGFTFFKTKDLVGGNFDKVSDHVYRDLRAAFYRSKEINIKSALDCVLRKRQELQAQLERRLKHILLGFDVDMDASDQSLPKKLQAKL